jgi:hypothetical protein
MRNFLKRAALRWSHPAVHGMVIQIPWDTNLPQYGEYHFAFAKGTLEQILAYTESNCPHRTRKQIEAWMKGQNETGIKVGIDCAGYVYHVIDEALAMAGAPRLRQTLGLTAPYADVDRLAPPPGPGQQGRVHRAGDILPGDLIRFDNPAHAGVVIDAIYTPEGRLSEVWYTHGNQARGPHIGWVHIADPALDLGDKRQSWYDEMWDGQSHNVLRDRRYSYVYRAPYYRGARPVTYKRTGIGVSVNGREVSFPVPTLSLNGHTIVRARTLAEAMGARMEYSDETEVLEMEMGGRWVRARVGQDVATAGGRPVTLEQPPELRAGWLYAPLRFIAEGLGYQVSWDGKTNSIQLRS